MDTEKLVRDELVYELRLRGFKNLQGETVRSMRKQLADILKTEAFGTLKPLGEDFKPPLLEEIDTCSGKIDSLEQYLVSGGGQSKSNIRYIDTKLKHIFGRLGRLQIEDSEDHQPTSRARQNLFSRLEAIETRIDRMNEETFQDRVDDVEPPGVLGVVAEPANIINIHKHQFEPRKWGIKFSGQEGLSVSAFLEQVEVKRRSSNLSEAELLSGISDLLEGSAAIWYSAKVWKIRTLGDFQRLLREEFQPHFYQSDLWSEIRSRRQGDRERVGIYFACMSHLFNRLPDAPTEEQKLEVLVKNILPYYIDNLGLATYNTVDELEGILKRLERNREIAEKRRSSSGKSAYVLEPDLVAPSPPLPSSSVSSTSRPFRVSPAVHAVEQARGCFNCHKRGHTFRNCRQKRTRKFCFRCGHEGTIKAQCPNCSGNGGSGAPIGRRSEVQ